MISILPFISEDQLDGEYQNKLVDLYMADATLNKTMPKAMRESIEWLLRLVNCFYSNRIEGNPTHPKELLQAQKKLQNEEDDIKQKQELMELLIHLEAQIKTQKANINVSNVSKQSFIKDLHQSFYGKLPESFLRVKDREGKDAFDSKGNPLFVKPGEYRYLSVIVGSHIPPSEEEVERHMKWLESQFNLEKIHGTRRVLAAAGLHHRFAWIHPFQDGNGRVVRLLTDCYMRCSGFGGYGLWSITRGFGREVQNYYAALAEADKPRQGNTDGRGILSDSGLTHFTKYFIDTALDQVTYFSDLLEPSKLGVRIDYYFEMRAKGSLPGDLPLLKITARDIYRLLLERGSMSRSAICQYLDKKEPTLRPILKQMESEELISAKPKHDIELRLSPTAVEFLFPQLW
jgi:Fic family protein